MSLIHSPAFMLSFVTDSGELAMVLLVNGNICVFMLLEASNYTSSRMLFSLMQMVYLVFQGCERDLYLSSGSIVLMKVKSEDHLL